MFTRRKHNRSGTISVVVVDKSGGRFTEIHRVGVARSEEEAAALEAEGRHWIDTYGGQQLIDFESKAETELRTVEDVLSGIKSARLTAVQTIINKVYGSIGFNEIKDEELRHLVIGRICQPMSKKATVDYLRRHFKDDVSLQKIYRYMDKRYTPQRERLHSHRGCRPDERQECQAAPQRRIQVHHRSQNQERVRNDEGPDPVHTARDGSMQRHRLQGLGQAHCRTLNRIVSLYLDFAELQAKSHTPMYMKDWIQKLDDFLRLSNRELLTHAGKISAEVARKKADSEHDKFQSRAQYSLSPVEIHFIDQFLEQQKALAEKTKKESDR